MGDSGEAGGWRRVEDLSPSELEDIISAFEGQRDRPLIETAKLYDLSAVGVVRLAVEYILRKRLLDANLNAKGGTSDG